MDAVVRKKQIEVVGIHSTLLIGGVSKQFFFMLIGLGRIELLYQLSCQFINTLCSTILLFLIKGLSKVIKN